MGRDAGLKSGHRPARWLDEHRPTKRRLVQLYCALLYNANLRGFAEGRIYTGKVKALCVPGLNCYSCPGAVGACPLGALQNAAAASGARAGFYVIGILMLSGLLLGRTICGWLCPFGLLQELLYKIPSRKIRKSRATRAMTRVKYALLAVFVIGIPLYYGLGPKLPLPAFCKYICPAGTLEGALPLLAAPGNAGLRSLAGPLFIGKLSVLILTAAACIVCFRSFCRFLCPLGAVYGLFSRLALIGVKVEEERCTGCGACTRSCLMDVRVVGDSECIHCGRCMAGCPEKAIAFYGKDAGHDRRKPGIAALVILLAALAWFNFLDPSARAAGRQEGPAVQEMPQVSELPDSQDEGSADSLPEGYDEGMRLPDFEASCLDGSVFRLGDNRGKVVIINLWATWCTPCVKELDDFCVLEERYGKDVSVLAVHSSLVTEDVGSFVSGKGWTVPVAVDQEDGRLFEIVGGTQTLPQTIVLNREGKVIYNKVGSVTPELLESLYLEASGE